MCPAMARSEATEVEPAQRAGRGARSPLLASCFLTRTFLVFLFADLLSVPGARTLGSISDLSPNFSAVATDHRPKLGV